MTAPTPTVKKKGPIVDPALCRCCRNIKKCRLLTSEYEWMGKKEIYSEMFMDCFGLLLSHLDGDTKESCICATCVVRLRDACAFREQVLQCEQAFIDAIIESKEDTEQKLNVLVKTEPVCDESGDSVGDRDDPDYQETDSQPEIEKLKQEEAATPAKIRVRRIKVGKETPPRKPKVRKESQSRKVKVGKQDLLRKMNLLKRKLDRMVQKPVKQQKENPRALTAKLMKKMPPESLDKENMAFQNALTIMINSYVCPFQNRISNYYCFYCRDQFTNPTELREHTLQHNPEALFESTLATKKLPNIDITRIDCRLCDEKIEDLTTFKNHISSVHNKTIHPVDNEFFTYKISLDIVQCTECGLTFPFFDALKKHMIEHFGTFICDQCGANFMELSSLRTHIHKHSKVDVNYPCEICGKNLKSKYSRYLHVATVHEKKPTVNCYKCDAAFLSYALRNKHLIEVHGDKRTFSCKLCDKVYNRRKTLMEHNRRSHQKVYKHQCDLCDQRFYIPSRLKDHMATHTGERNYRCEYCDKSYPRLTSLQDHLRSHNNDRRYKCEVCNSAFTQRGSLKSHVKSHHQGYDMDSFS